VNHEFHKVQKGTKGIDVTVLQAFLHSSMFTGKDGNPLEIDGVCGDNTVYAINTFKKLNGVYKIGETEWKPDGVFDETCWERLGLGVVKNA